MLDLYLYFYFVLKFGRHVGSTADMPARFQSKIKVLSSNVKVWSEERDIDPISCIFISKVIILYGIIVDDNIIKEHQVDQLRLNAVPVSLILPNDHWHKPQRLGQATVMG